MMYLNNLNTMRLAHGWGITVYVDDDKHLNILIDTSGVSGQISETETDIYSDNGESLRLRFTTPDIENEYIKDMGLS